MLSRQSRRSGMSADGGVTFARNAWPDLGLSFMAGCILGCRAARIDVSALRERAFSER